MLQPVNSMRRPATPRQRELFDFVCEYQQEHDRPPTLLEMASHLGVRNNRAWQLTLVLVEKGWLRRGGSWYQARTVVPATFED